MERISTLQVVLATVHNVLLGEFRIIINVNHKREELRTKTLTHRCTNQQLMLTLWDPVRSCCYYHPPTPFVLHTHRKNRSTSRDLKSMDWKLYQKMQSDIHPCSIPFLIRALLIKYSTIKCFLGIYRWLKAWCATTLWFIHKKIKCINKTDQTHFLSKTNKSLWCYDW